MIKFPINLHSMTPLWKMDPDYRAFAEIETKTLDSHISSEKSFADKNDFTEDRFVSGNESVNENVIQRLFRMRAGR